MAFWNKLFKKTISDSRDLDLFLRTGSISNSGVTVTCDTAMRCTTVYACVRVLAESVAQLPLITYRRRKDGGKDRATEHWLYSLLHDSPNEWQTSFEFREMMMGHVLLRGNAYAFINRLQSGRVVELLPLHPDRVEPKQDKDFRITYTITDENGAQQVLRREQIFHIKGLSSNGLVGLNPIEQHRESIGLALATEEHGSRLFSNGANPSGVLEHPMKLSKEAQQRLKETFEEKTTGLLNAHKPMILEEGMKWSQMGMTSEDSQFLETRKFQRNDIASMFRVPPHKIGDLERATFSNIEHQALEFVTDSLMPNLKRWEQAIHMALLTEKDRKTIFVEFLVDGLLRGDIKTRYEAYAKAITNGILSPNEVRSLENLNPRDGGDEYLTPLNMIADSKQETDNAN